MKKIQTNKNRKLNQLIFLIIIVIFAIFTWRNNEKKSVTHSSNTQTQPQQSLPNDLGQYDTVMANDHLGQNRNVPVDYYMLALSWSPEFCDLQKQKNSGNVPKHLQYQCNDKAQFGWVIHGLWPQNAQAKSPADHPRFCKGDLAKLPETLIKQYLPESPGASLLQGQWEKHGACAFNDAESYFAKQRELFRSLNLPAQDLSRKELFQWMKKYNPQLKNAYLGASKNELYICYDKQWSVMDCPR